MTLPLLLIAILVGWTALGIVAVVIWNAAKRRVTR